VRLSSQGSAPPHSSSLSSGDVDETTQRITGVAWNGMRVRRHLSSGRLSNAVRWVLHSALPTPQRQIRRSRPTSRKIWDLVETTLSVGGRVVKPATPPSSRTSHWKSDSEWSDDQQDERQDCYSAPKVTVGPKQAPMTKTNTPAKHTEPSQSKELVASIQPNQSPIEEISDILDHNPLTHMWNLLAGSSHLSQPSPLDQLARGLYSKSSSFL
jgi:hypothetical protein